MGNLWKHTKLCWGEETVAAADNMKDIHVALKALEKKSVDSSITSAFEHVSKGKVTYSHHQYNTAEAWWVLSDSCISWSHSVYTSAKIVQWIAESKRPFQIVNDCGFQSLMKAGIPGYCIPSAETVSHDVKTVFTRVRKNTAKMLQVISVTLSRGHHILTRNFPGIQWQPELCDRCMDITKPQGICCIHCSFWTWQDSDLHAAWSCWGGKVAFWH
jgi:hypothetical protein